ncbi:MAG: calcium-binding protein [Candidatus Sulfotelmatobacter sp.]
MTHQSTKPVVVHIDVRKLKRDPDTNLPSFSKAKLKKLIDEAVVDAYGEEEQVGGFLTMMEEHLALPFSTKVFGVDVVVENVDMTCDGQIVAACRRGKTRQKIEILDLPLPTPAPAGTEWIAAYRYWRRGF